MVDKKELKRKRQEDLAVLFANLARDDAPILVEGKRDREALVKGGIEPRRITMLHGRSRLDIEEKFMDCKDIILLLDYDAEGLKMIDEFKAIFSRTGKRVNTWYWSKIREIFTGHIDCIENLRGFLDS
ncbi:MAG: hypothetical protein GYA24_03960 [Candidatus Lokiarchaeota archaeon]|nr:hypothetical protein [Candidatus Lokiarchaeota archaeon]